MTVHEAPPSYADAKPPRPVAEMNAERAAMLADLQGAAEAYAAQQDAKRKAFRAASAAPSAVTWGPALFAAIAAAQASVRGVEKDSRNEHHKYKYASAEAMIEEARTALAAQGLALLAVHAEARADGPERPDRMHVLYILSHASGQWMEIHSSTPILPDKGRPEDKAEATAKTYDFGYVARGVCMLNRVDEGATVDARDDRDYQPRKAAPSPRPDEPPADDKPTASELDAAARFAAATTLPEHAEAAAFAATLCNSGQVGSRGRARLGEVGRARRAALVAGAPPTEPAALDWGDKAALIMRHATEARGRAELGVASLELEKAQADGMPAALVAPAGSLILDKRKALEGKP